MDHYELCPSNRKIFYHVVKGEPLYEVLQQKKVKCGRYHTKETLEELLDMAEGYEPPAEYIVLSDPSPKPASRHKDVSEDFEHDEEKEIFHFNIEISLEDVMKELYPDDTDYGGSSPATLMSTASPSSTPNSTYNKAEFEVDGYNNERETDIVSYSEGFLQGIQQEQQKSRNILARQQQASEEALRKQRLDSDNAIFELKRQQADKEHLLQEELLRQAEIKKYDDGIRVIDAVMRASADALNMYNANKENLTPEQLFPEVNSQKQALINHRNNL